MRDQAIGTAEALVEIETMATQWLNDYPQMAVLAAEWLPAPLGAASYDGSRPSGIGDPTPAKAAQMSRDGVAKRWVEITNLIWNAGGHLASALAWHHVGVCRPDSLPIERVIASARYLQAFRRNDRETIKLAFEDMREVDAFRLNWLGAKANAAPEARGHSRCSNRNDCPDDAFAMPGRNGRCDACAIYLKRTGVERPNHSKRSA